MLHTSWPQEFVSERKVLLRREAAERPTKSQVINSSFLALNQETNTCIPPGWADLDNVFSRPRPSLSRLRGSRTVSQSAALTFSMLPLVTLVTPCYPLLPHVTPCYPLLPLVTPCYPL